ncbi:sigma-70 family RNA polymerase sigma factor [Clostridium sp.]|uniref:sigma-70 family RNA polymerase sigma factor n=1 Tax=Clostridium sp. TaxID=1506 RepID=UPI002FC82349
MDDSAIVKLIKSKDQDGLEALIEKYGKLIYGVIDKNIILNNKNECVKECFNDILMSLWINIGAYDNERGDLINFLIAVSKYKTIDYIRRNKKKFDISDIEECVISQEDDKDIIFNDNEGFYELIKGLDIDTQRIFSRRYIFGEEIDKISKEMKLSTSNIYTKLSRGRQKIKKRLEGENIG